jgi:nicotinamide-nucleotide amidase
MTRAIVMSQTGIFNRALKERAEKTIKMLRQNNQSLVTAESCTAGLLAALLSKPEGAGEVLEGGFVCYSKEQKCVALHVSPVTLKEKTAVSAGVAEEMARGALNRSTATTAIAVTGVLGPKPDEDGNPVGLVYLAISSATEAKTVRYQFGDLPHEDLCARTIVAALDLLELGGQ